MFNNIALFEQIDRVIPVAGKEELTSFHHLFWTKTQKNMTDGHIWFSVFNRPPRSRFTRVQRLTCCLALLFTSMMANIMFYQSNDSNDEAANVKVSKEKNSNFVFLLFDADKLFLVIFFVGLCVWSDQVYVPDDLRGNRDGPHCVSGKHRHCRSFQVIVYFLFTTSGDV